jgi:hypothetical protein
VVAPHSAVAQGLDAAPASAQNKSVLKKNGADGARDSGRRAEGDAKLGHQP